MAKAMTAQDFVPNLSPMILAAFEIEQPFMLSHGYIEHEFKVSNWIALEYMEEVFKTLQANRQGDRTKRAGAVRD